MARKFPTLAVVLLAVGLVWLLSSMNLIAINIPWIPLVLIIVAIGMIFNRFSK